MQRLLGAFWRSGEARRLAEDDQISRRRTPARRLESLGFGRGERVRVATFLRKLLPGRSARAGIDSAGPGVVVSRRGRSHDIARRARRFFAVGGTGRARQAQGFSGDDAPSRWRERRAEHRDGTLVQVERERRIDPANVELGAGHEDREGTRADVPAGRRPMHDGDAQPPLLEDDRRSVLVRVGHARTRRRRDRKQCSVRESNGQRLRLWRGQKCADLPSRVLASRFETDRGIVPQARQREEAERDARRERKRGPRRRNALRRRTNRSPVGREEESSASRSQSLVPIGHPALDLGDLVAKRFEVRLRSVHGSPPTHSARAG